VEILHRQQFGETLLDPALPRQALALGTMPEEIAQDFPSLQLPDVYRVIGYCLKHSAQLAA